MFIPLRLNTLQLFLQTNTQYLRRFVRLISSNRRKVVDERYEQVGAAFFAKDDLPESLDWREKGTYLTLGLTATLYLNKNNFVNL